MRNACIMAVGKGGTGGGGGCGTIGKTGRFRIIGKLETQLDISVFGNKKYVYIPQMNEKMTAFKYIVQCYKCNCSLIEENRENSLHFTNEKTVIIQIIWNTFQICRA